MKALWYRKSLQARAGSLTQTEGSKPSGKVSIGVYGRSRTKEGLFAVDRATDSRTNRLDSSHVHIFITNPHDGPCQLSITIPILEMRGSRAYKGTLNKQKKSVLVTQAPRFESGNRDLNLGFAGGSQMPH